MNNSLFDKIQTLKNQTHIPPTDQHTHLPALVSLLAALEEASKKDELGVIYIHIVNFTDYEAVYGRNVSDLILEKIAEGLQDLPVSFFGKRKTYVVYNISRDAFVLFVDAPASIFNNNYQNEYLRLKKSFEHYINAVVQPMGLYKNVSISLSYTHLEKQNGELLSVSAYRAIKEASYAARYYSSALQHENWQLMKHIVSSRAIKTVYQPIVSLKSGSILGFEALSRGPAGTIYESPENLFIDAEQFNYLLELESVCQLKAIQTASDFIGENYLFLNMSPILLSPANSDSSLQDTLEQYHIHPSKVVIELTERNYIQDYKSLLQALEPLRNQGFMIAIDDAGAGYSSLQAIAELQPEFVKMDMSLVRDVDHNQVKRALLEAFVNLTYKIDTNIIAEGIETEAELKTLIEMGCDYGQGFLLAKPGDIDRTIQPSVKETITRWTDCRENRSMLNLESIMQSQPSIPPQMPVKDLLPYLQQPVNGLVVCQGFNPVGLIMRDQLLNTQNIDNGNALTAADIMDQHPLILPDHTSLTEAIYAITKESDRKVTDYLILTRDGSFAGVVPIARIMETVAEMNA